MIIPGLRPPQALSHRGMHTSIPTRLVRGKKTIKVWADADTGWHQSQIGAEIAYDLGIPDIKKLAKTKTAWAAASERIGLHKVAIDRLELLDAFAGGKTLCSIGPVILNVTTHPLMAEEFMLGPDLLALLRVAIIFDGLKKHKFLCHGPGQIPAAEKYRGKVRATPKWLMVPCRIRSGGHEIEQFAEFDTGAEATVVGVGVAERLGFPRLSLLAHSLTRRGGGGGRADAFRFPVDKIEFLKEDSSVACSIGPVAILVTTAFEPDSIRIGRDVMNAIRLRLDLDAEWFQFQCQTP